MTELFWIDGPWTGRLAVASRPRGEDWLADELKSWKQAGIDVVASLLEAGEAIALGLEQEKAICEANGVAFLSLPIADRSVPEKGANAALILRELETKLSGGRNAVVHCRQGVGRSGMIAAALLIEQGLTPSEALRRVRDARGVEVPETSEQRLWIERFSAALTQRR